MTAEYGVGMFFFGMTVTLIGFLIAFMVVNYNLKQERKKKYKETGPLADLHKYMPGVKYGDDCQ
tara:strand:- start:313 stop:504 length:192 start_codon:yes stop_codon:yes gene_type:complete